MGKKKTGKSGAARRQAQKNSGTFAGRPLTGTKMSLWETQMFDMAVSEMEDAFSASPELACQRPPRKALRRAIGEFLDRFEGTYQRREILSPLAKAYTLPGPWSYGIKAGMADISMGAAIWFLDRLDASEEEWRMCEIAASTKTRYTAEDELDVQAVCHAQEDLDAVAEVLRSWAEYREGDISEILGLIEEETVQELKRSFEDLFFDLVGKYLDIVTRTRPGKIEWNAPAPSFEEIVKPVTSLLPPEKAPLDIGEDVRFLVSLYCDPSASENRCMASVSTRRAAEALSSIRCKDPFAICAGYLFLLHDGDLLSKLGLFTICTLRCACRFLPWEAIDEIPTPAPPYESDPLETVFHPFVHTEKTRERGHTIVLDGDYLTEEQLFFLATGMLLPHDSSPSKELKEWFMLQGIPEERAAGLSYAAWIAMKAGPLKTALEYRDYLGERPEDDEPELDSGETEPAIDPAVQIAELAKQVKDLKSRSYEAERAVRDSQGQMERMEKEWDHDRAELARLREAVLTTSAAEEKDEGPQIQFPQPTKRKIVSFGGCDNWLKAIRPMLPDVRFFGPGTLPDVGAIRNADVVWIQTNVMAHKFFYRIVEIARKEDVPICYFGTGGARRCAEQLIRYEAEIGQQA